MGNKCGVCGDPWDGIRENEAGGRYATGTLSKKYIMNSEIRVQVQITANHRGWFEFKLCPNNNFTKPVHQTCLDKYPLAIVNGSGSRYYLPDHLDRIYTVPLQLPRGLTCDQCVLQWRYHVGML